MFYIFSRLRYIAPDPVFGQNRIFTTAFFPPKNLNQQIGHFDIIADFKNGATILLHSLENKLFRGW